MVAARREGDRPQGHPAVQTARDVGGARRGATADRCNHEDLLQSDDEGDDDDDDNYLNDDSEDVEAEVE